MWKRVVLLGLFLIIDLSGKYTVAEQLAMYAAAVQSGEFGPPPLPPVEHIVICVHQIIPPPILPSKPIPTAKQALPHQPPPATFTPTAQANCWTFQDGRGYVKIGAVQSDDRLERYAQLDAADDYLLVNVPLQDSAGKVVGHKTVLRAKANIPDYQPTYDPNMLHTVQLSNWLGRFFCDSHSFDIDYFANKLRTVPPEKVMHCLNGYRLWGFQKYVQSLAGFEHFLLTIGPELNNIA